jgi:hypothetical protein
MAGSEWLTYDDFAGRVGEPFDVATAVGEPIRLELIEATEGSEPGGTSADGEERRQFSLVFRGPVDQPLAQGIQSLDHGTLGELVLFLVPIGPDATGMRYEAAFA